VCNNSPAKSTSPENGRCPSGGADPTPARAWRALSRGAWSTQQSVRREPGRSVPPVQILVVVANTQPSSLSAEVQKASAATWIVHGLIRPKASSEGPGKWSGSLEPSLRGRKGYSRTLLSWLRAERWNLTLPTALLGALGIVLAPLICLSTGSSDLGSLHEG